MTCQLKRWAGSIHSFFLLEVPSLARGAGKGKILANALHVCNVLQLQGRDGGEGSKERGEKGEKGTEPREAEAQCPGWGLSPAPALLCRAGSSHNDNK